MQKNRIRSALFLSLSSAFWAFLYPDPGHCSAKYTCPLPSTVKQLQQDGKRHLKFSGLDFLMNSNVYVSENPDKNWIAVIRKKQEVLCGYNGLQVILTASLPTGKVCSLYNESNPLVPLVDTHRFLDPNAPTQFYGECARK